ncbi:peptidase M14 [Marinomonas ushuaiensis DSM 15871]|uniref:Peptidase M14 n=1 Tax=Marinomonas ushuaiensis DSM 15871 TaxID=1122207 RepID=X7EAA5_9GAMM|nr:M14 family metallopeptidase [Marinomonas ushuaiensis]ETX12146.1 peptidase M14 [Marinomonas ushuaiensis DSM 15871]
MNCIYSTTIESTINQLIEKFGKIEYQDQLIEAWVFGDKSHRQRAEKELSKHGVNAKLRSAYKPLLHFFLEEIDVLSSNIKNIEVHYPLHKAASEKRFLLETYPLSALIKKSPVHFVANEKMTDAYQIILHSDAGVQSKFTVFAPNHLHQDCIKQTNLSPSGWLRITNSEGVITLNERLVTDYERLFSEGMEAISEYTWKDSEPYFEELNIKVFLPWKDQPLPYKHEVISLSEALHEDFYFSIQEWFKVKVGYQPNDREGQPGQIVPEIHYRNEDSLSLCIETRPYDAQSTTGQQTLDCANAPISMEQVQTELETIIGSNFTAESITGRIINARYHKGSDFPVMISGGQHANETTGVIGTLRAAKVLNKQEGSHFTISPQENPDGYALHQRLITDNPFHMHHASRYTALGDDLEYRNKGHLYEKEIRHKARKISHAQLHINLHGYPSHEWTRPLSGYVPRGFDMWTIPKGFFLIIRHNPEEKWSAYAEEFTHLVTLKLIKIPGVLDFNNEQIKLYKKHAGETNFRIINGFPCLISQSKPEDIPMQLITEYPDETLYGEDFVTGHDVQTATVLAAYEVHQLLSSKR